MSVKWWVVASAVTGEPGRPGQPAPWRRNRPWTGAGSAPGRRSAGRGPGRAGPSAPRPRPAGPGSPRRLDHSPSCMAPPWAMASSSQCWARITSRSDAYSIARRIRRASCTPRPSSVKSRTPERGHLAHRRQLLALPADGDGAGDVDVAQRRAPEVEHLVDHRRRVDGRRGVGHGHERGVAAERCRPAAGLDGLRLLLARLAQVAVEVDEARRHDAAAGVDDLVGGRGPPPPPTTRPSATTTSARRAPLASTTVPPLIDELRHRSLRSSGTPEPSNR